MTEKIAIIVLIFYAIIRYKKALHMFQQNRYNDKNRYLVWLKKNILKSFNIIELLPIIIYLVIEEYFIFSMLVIYIFLIISELISKEKTKIPLAITARVKRLIITSVIIFALPILLLSNYLYVVYILLIFGMFKIVIFANIINKPIEKLVFTYYRKKAIKKLDDLKHLIKIGITGSYGKTSSKLILTSILNQKYNAMTTPENYNTPNGLMLTINNYMDKFSDYFVAEMGACRVGEIKELTDMIKPHHGILTKIGVAHLETFKTQENIQKTKFELIESLPKDGIAVLNKDDKYQVEYNLKNNCNVVWIGIDNKGDYVASNIEYSNNGMKFDVSYKKEKHSFTTKLLGKSNVYNILGAVALAHQLDTSFYIMQKAISRINAPTHRLELKKLNNMTIIDDAYNSNPVGSKMALDVLSKMPGYRIIVTPGMIDLGEEENFYNKEFGKHMKDNVDFVILVGKKQTEAIFSGLEEVNFDKKNISVVPNLNEAFLKISEINEKNKFVLLENDLPDIFNE